MYQYPTQNQHCEDDQTLTIRVSDTKVRATVWQVGTKKGGVVQKGSYGASGPSHLAHLMFLSQVLYCCPTGFLAFHFKELL